MGLEQGHDFAADLPYDLPKPADLMLLGSEKWIPSSF